VPEISGFAAGQGRPPRAGCRWRAARMAAVCGIAPAAARAARPRPVSSGMPESEVEPFRARFMIVGSFGQLLPISTHDHGTARLEGTFSSSGPRSTGPGAHAPHTGRAGSGLVAHGPRSTGPGGHAPHTGRAGSGLVAHGPRSTGPGGHAPHTGRTIPGRTTGTHPKFGQDVAFSAFTSAGRRPVCAGIYRFGIGERGRRTSWVVGEIGPPGPFFRAAPLPLSLRRTEAPERASYQAKTRVRPTYPHMRSLEIAVRKGFTGRRDHSSDDKGEAVRGRAARGRNCPVRRPLVRG
jgi:hypothetical protein